MADAAPARAAEAPPRRHIQLLPPEEARRIAAGEVIDRPAALIREFLDNAIDAGAANIDVTIERGGSTKAEVADDGGGMSREDLELCWLTHATSKIRSLDDLASAETLGFRGEALAAAAAVARLEIVSSLDGREAWQLAVGPGESHPPRLERGRRTGGSTVRALNLYDTIPARKRFLKREGTEAALCRQVFLDKALAFPEISFRLTQDGKPKDFLPRSESKKERFAAALLGDRERDFLHEIHVAGEGFSVDLVVGGPELCRNDKRMIYVFANGRRIADYALVQALEYGTAPWFPNGTHPVGAVYVDIDPALADFNIHPAKREVRFRDGGAIHHAITTGLRDFCRRYSFKAGQELADAAAGGRERPLFGGYCAFADTGGETADVAAPAYAGYVPGEGVRRGDGFSSGGGPAAMEALLEQQPRFASLAGGMVAETAPLYGEPRYVGRAFGLFILVEWGDKLFIIDQHAAHERIRYDRFLAGPVPAQELLVPIPFSTDSEEDDRFLASRRDELARLGVLIEQDESGWRIAALPALWRMGDRETVRAILELQKAGELMAERWAATICCHEALRDGDTLDDASAFALAREALALPDPHCPHGRPVWTEISREALFRAVKRA